MSETRVFPLPDSLPASLKGGPEGFNALCALLGIVGRQDKRQLRNHSRVSEILKAEGQFDEWDKARAGAENTARLFSASEERLESAAEDVANEQELIVAKHRYEHLLAAREKRDAGDRIVAALSSTVPPKKARRARGSRKRYAGPAVSVNPGQAAVSGVFGAVKGMFRKRGR